MKDKVIVALMVLFWIVVAVGLYVFYYTYYIRPVVSIATAYLEALAEGDLETAAFISQGQAKEAVARLEGQEVKAKVIEIKAETLATSQNWARITAAVELELPDKTADIGWYDLEVLEVNEELREWAVVSFKETGPPVNGSGRQPVSAEVVQKSSEIFNSYLKDLAAGRYDEAGNVLAGPALKAHQAAAGILAKGPLFTTVGQVSLEPVWRKGKYLKALVDYTVDDRQVTVTALFYLTQSGWRIVQIN